MGLGTVEVNDSIAQNFDLPVDSGIAITQLATGGPADQAGLQAYDVIVAIDGQKITNNGQLLAVLAQHKPGDSVSVDYYRGNVQKMANVTLTARPAGG
jgi:S1-C subfamily serine protease